MRYNKKLLLNFSHFYIFLENFYPIDWCIPTNTKIFHFWKSSALGHFYIIFFPHFQGEGVFNEILYIFWDGNHLVQIIIRQRMYVFILCTAILNHHYKGISTVNYHFFSSKKPINITLIFHKGSNFCTL